MPPVCLLASGPAMCPLTTQATRSKQQRQAVTVTVRQPCSNCFSSCSSRTSSTHLRTAAVSISLSMLIAEYPTVGYSRSGMLSRSKQLCSLSAVQVAWAGSYCCCCSCNEVSTMLHVMHSYGRAGSGSLSSVGLFGSGRKLDCIIALVLNWRSEFWTV